jgi:hypothetical protein
MRLGACNPSSRRKSTVVFPQNNRTELRDILSTARDRRVFRFAKSGGFNTPRPPDSRGSFFACAGGGNRLQGGYSQWR